MVEVLGVKQVQVGSVGGWREIGLGRRCCVCRGQGYHHIDDGRL